MPKKQRNENYAPLLYTKIQISREMWTRINQEKNDPSQTIDDVLKRLFKERDAFRKKLVEIEA